MRKLVLFNRNNFLHGSKVKNSVPISIINTLSGHKMIVQGHPLAEGPFRILRQINGETLLVPSETINEVIELLEGQTRASRLESRQETRPLSSSVDLGHDSLER